MSARVRNYTEWAIRAVPIWHTTDMDMALDKIVPEELNWLHTDEGPEWALIFVDSHT